MEMKIVRNKEISSWSDLHPDMLSLIKSRLLARDIPTFNMICKPWRSVTLASRVNVFRPPIDSPLAHTPCLVTLHKNAFQFYHPVYNVTYKLDPIPELSPDARIRSSAYGWLLLTTPHYQHRTLFFFNPFTEEIIFLPYLRWPNQMSLITFTSPPTSPDCIVFGIEQGLLYLANVNTTRRGDDSWEYLELDTGTHKDGYLKKFLRCAYCSPVLVDGKCYFMGKTGNIGVFDIREKTWEVYGEAWPSRRLARPCSMVMIDGGGLLGVFLSRELGEVHMQRFDLTKMVWEDVESLGNDKTLYVSDGTSFLETSVEAWMGNKIYFPLFDRDDIGVVYNVSTKMYHSCDGEYCSKYRSDLAEPQPCTWIKPVYTPTTDVEELTVEW